MIRTLLKPLSFLPAIFLMYVIYNFSAQPAEVSSQVSYQVSYKIVETADKLLDTNMEYWEIDEWAYRIHGATRKLAHMTEYFALAVAVSFPLYVYGVHGIWLMLLAGLICVGFACGDEYHQSFVEGRSPSRRDVMIDSFGIFWGIILVRIVGWTGRMTIFRPRKKKVKVKKSKKYTAASGQPYDPEEDIPQREIYYRQAPTPGRTVYQNPIPNDYPVYRRPAPQNAANLQRPEEFSRQADFSRQNLQQQSFSQQDFLRQDFSQQDFSRQDFSRQDFPQRNIPPQDIPQQTYPFRQPAPTKNVAEEDFRYDPKDPFQDWLDDSFPKQE